MAQDPFKVVEAENTYTDILPNGDVVLMKKESDVPIVLKNYGRAKDWALKALEKMALMRVKDTENVDTTEMTHIEVAMLRLAKAAAGGDPKAVTELLDRILGKPKQYNENTNVTMSLDDVLQQLAQEEGEVVDVDTD
jgi:hypothetical protein